MHENENENEIELILPMPSIDRLNEYEEIINRWRGPVSVSLAIESKKLQSAVSAIQKYLDWPIQVFSKKEVKQDFEVDQEVIVPPQDDSVKVSSFSNFHFVSLFVDPYDNNKNDQSCQDEELFEMLKDLTIQHSQFRYLLIPLSLNAIDRVVKAIGSEREEQKKTGQFDIFSRSSFVSEDKQNRESQQQEQEESQEVESIENAEYDDIFDKNKLIQNNQRRASPLQQQQQQFTYDITRSVLKLRDGNSWAKILVSQWSSSLNHHELVIDTHDVLCEDSLVSSFGLFVFLDKTVLISEKGTPKDLCALVKSSSSNTKARFLL